MTELKLSLRGEHFNLSSYIAKQIPYFKVLLQSVQQETDFVTHLDMPIKFIQIIVQFIHGDQSITYLKSLLVDFNQDKCIIWLKYLGLDQLLSDLYLAQSIPEMVNGKIVVVG